MGKIFGITSYIIFIAFITFIIAGYAKANQTVTFLEKQEARIYDVPKDLITATLVANTQGQYDIFIKNEPIADLEISQTNVTYRLMMFSVLLYENDDNYHYEMIILVNDYQNIDPFAFISDDALALMVDVAFESNPEGFNQSVFQEQFVQLYDDSMHMYAIDQRYFINDTETTRIERIEIFYPTEGLEISTSKLINTDVYKDKNLSIPDDNQIDLNTLVKTNTQLDAIEDKETWYFNNELNVSFQSYNYFSYVYIGVEILIFIPITYFIFFHKNIKRMKTSKEIKK
jgi:hypothetical protein